MQKNVLSSLHGNPPKIDPMPSMIERTSCPFCDAPVGTSLYARPYSDPAVRQYLDGFYSHGAGVEHAYLENAVYEVVECPNCQGMYQKYIPDAALMQRLYDHWINPTAAWDRRSKHSLSYHASNMSEIMQLLSMMPKPPGKTRILDFGTGWGEWALAAKGYGCDVHGCELAQSRIEHALHNGLKIIDYDAITDGQFDLINAEQVFEHVSNPLQIMQHLLRGLAPGGMLKVNVPDAPNMKKRLAAGDWNAAKGTRLSLNPLAPLEHINLFFPPTGAKMASICGAVLKQVPISTQLQCATFWRGRSRIMRNLAMPFYRNLLSRKNYFIFVRLGN